MFSTINLDGIEYDVDTLRHSFMHSYSDPYEIYNNLFPLIKIINAYTYIDYKVKKAPKYLFNDYLMKSILDNFVIIFKKNKIDKQVRDLSILLDIDIFERYGYFKNRIMKITDTIHVLDLTNIHYLIVKNVGLYKIDFDIQHIKTIHDVFEITNYAIPDFYCITDMLFEKRENLKLFFE